MSHLHPKNQTTVDLSRVWLDVLLFSWTGNFTVPFRDQSLERGTRTHQHVALGLGMMTPIVARAAMSMIFLNAGMLECLNKLNTTAVNWISGITVYNQDTWSVFTSHSIAAPRNSLSEYEITCSVRGTSRRCGSRTPCVSLELRD
jgi:hypothetical protein